MMDCRSETFITDRIPHRPPFLWLDRVVEITDNSILAEKKIPEDLDLFQGHYPDYPLMPGVLLCEAVFQAGGVLLAEMLRSGSDISEGDPALAKPVLTRILGAKFKREVRPGDTIAVSARLTERLGAAWFLKGAVRVDGKVAVQVEFGCILKE
jgi:3-hydroxyacyl-[acyl-carrier-protein] dehydratase